MDFRALDRTLRTAKPRAIAYDLALDGGLSARIAADGKTKTLYWRGKMAGRVTRFRLGNYPDMTLQEAAAKALEVRSAIRNGEDPNLEARRKKAGSDSPVTVREAAERFKVEHLAAKVGQRWEKEAGRILDKDIVPKIGATRLGLVKREDLTTLVAKKAAALKKRKRTGIAANRIVALLGRFFGFCADKGWI